MLLEFWSKGYLAISLIASLKIERKFLTCGKKCTVRKTNLNYDLVIKRLYLYYDMKLVIFGIDKDKKPDNTISSIHTAIHKTTTNIISDRDSASSNHRSKHASTFLHTPTWVDRPYIALNSETYITIRQQELRMCQRIGYEFYCEELFVVKHKSKYSCKSAIHFDLDSEIIKENCEFNFYYNKTGIAFPLY